MQSRSGCEPSIIAGTEETHIESGNHDGDYINPTSVLDQSHRFHTQSFPDVERQKGFCKQYEKDGGPTLTS